MIHTEEMKRQINAAGFQVIKFKWFVKKFHDAVDSLVDLLKKMVQRVVKVLNNFVAEVKEIRKMLPKQHYKFCRKLGIQNYQCFFQRRRIYRARSCC